MLSKYPVRAADVASRVIDGEAILVSATKGRVFTLNSVGTKIWEIADGTLSLSQIVDAISEVFETDKEQASKDCSEFIQALIDRGIMRLSDNLEAL